MLFLNEFAESLSKEQIVYSYVKFLDQLEKIHGALTIQDLIDKIEGASLNNEDSINVFKQFDNALF